MPVSGRLERSLAGSVLVGFSLLTLPLQLRAEQNKANGPVQGAVDVVVGDSGATTLDAVTVVSTGSRGGKRTIADSPAPIDVISGDQLIRTGKTNLKDILGTLIPSFSFSKGNIGGSSWLVPAFTMRGLNGDQVLVLVNGKRRHNTAVMNNQSAIGNGGSPVDLDLIPASLVERIEVLRDGASAQYGSDAIAGVINIILKNADSGGSVELNAGQYYQGDGFTTSSKFNSGFALGDQGFINISLEAKRSQRTYRNGAATERLYARLADGSDDPREATANRQYYGRYYGNPEESTVNSGYNLELPLTDDSTFYSFTTLSYKESASYTGAVLPSSVRTLPEVFPDGYLGERGLYEHDWQSVNGVRGTSGAWNWDLSTSYGEDSARLNGKSGFAASWGPDAPTGGFHLSQQIFKQWTTNFDLSRQFDIGLSDPLEFAGGFEHRWEKFVVRAGDPIAYLQGDYVIPEGQNNAGQTPPAGAGVYSALTEEDAGSIHRNSYAAYIDIGVHPVTRWYTGFAARFEHYDDASGNTAIAKLTTRYELTPKLAVRATANTGFRAPSLAQVNYATTTASRTYNADGSSNQFYTKLLRSNSPEAQLLGAKPLKPEKSTNFSLGLAYEATRNTRITLDAYQIQIRDRIVQTGYLSGSVVSALLADYGYNKNLSAQYYTNGVDTRTRGVDLVAESSYQLGHYGDLRLSASYGWNKTTLTHISDTPSQLSSLGIALIDRQRQSYLTNALPRDKFILTGNWSQDALSLDFRLTRYGRYIEAQTLAVNDRHYGAELVADLELGYQFNDRLKLAIGANNLFDAYPDKIGLVTYGAGAYGSLSPLGINGGYYYSRLTYSF